MCYCGRLTSIGGNSNAITSLNLSECQDKCYWPASQIVLTRHLSSYNGKLVRCASVSQGGYPVEAGHLAHSSSIFVLICGGGKAGEMEYGEVGSTVKARNPDYSPCFGERQYIPHTSKGFVPSAKRPPTSSPSQKMAAGDVWEDFASSRVLGGFGDEKN